jgi:uncharacterized coiled-coil protein SlyX
VNRPRTSESDSLTRAIESLLKEQRLARLEVTVDERARALGESIPDVVRRQQEAIDRSRDVLHRAEQRLVRGEASLERSRAAIQRDDAEIQREVAASSPGEPVDGARSKAALLRLLAAAVR